MIPSPEKTEENLTSIREAFDLFPNAILEVDDRGELLWGNSKFKELLTPSSHDPTHLLLDDIFEIQEQALRPAFFHSTAYLDTKLKASQNDTQQVRIRLIPIKGERTRNSSFILVESKDDYNFVKERFLKAQRAEALGAIAAAVCHEFNNFLTPLVLASQFLKSQGLPEPQLRFADVIESSSQRASDLVHQILELARHTKKEKIELKPRLLVKEMEKFLLSTLPKSTLIQSSLCAEEPTLIASPSHLFQSLLNLSLIAYSKTLSDGCSITLKIETVSKNQSQEKKDHARITVEGLRSSQHSSRSLESIRAFCEEIAGLPLESAYSAVELLVSDSSGTFEIEQDTDERFIAHIDLPIQSIVRQERLDAISTAPSSRFIEPTAHRNHVLIADSDQSIREMIGEYLTQIGYTPLFAKDGAEAMLLVGKYEKRLCSIFCELELSHIDGATIAKALREKTKLRIHAITASERQRDETLNKETLFNSVSKKPLQINRLSELIQPLS